MKNLFNKVFSKKNKRTASAIAAKAVSGTCGSIHLSAHMTMLAMEKLESNTVHRLTGEMKEDILKERYRITKERQLKIDKAANDLLNKAKSLKSVNRKTLTKVAEVNTINPDLTVA